MIKMAISEAYSDSVVLHNLLYYYYYIITLLIIHKDKTKEPCLMSVFICDEDTLAVLDKFLVGFYVSNKVNFQNNYFTNKLIRWFVFEAAVQKTCSTSFIGSKTLYIKI